MSDAMMEVTGAERNYLATRDKGERPETFRRAEADSGVQTVLEEPLPDKPQASRMVPHGALHAEREEHKKTRAALQRLRTEAAQMQQNLEALTAAAQVRAVEAQPQPQNPPQPGEDFIGFTRWQAEETNRMNARAMLEKQREQQDRQMAEAEKGLWREWSQAVIEARAEHKDIDEAMDFLLRARNRQLDILGQVDERLQNRAVRESQIQAEWREIMIAAFRQGKNPAGMVYEIARAYGYGGDGEKKFARLKGAQAASRTLTATQGKEAGDPLLLETVANLSDMEFAKWYKNNKGSFRKMFGG